MDDSLEVGSTETVQRLLLASDQDADRLSGKACIRLNSQAAVCCCFGADIFASGQQVVVSC
jgi:hypothetical protein